MPQVGDPQDDGPGNQQGKLGVTPAYKTSGHGAGDAKIKPEDPPAFPDYPPPETRTPVCDCIEYNEDLGFVINMSKPG